jgi:uncharacterized protein with von Willebrand factor type A (vWA) domain
MTELADNIVHFARTLRRAGFPLGTGQINEAMRAVDTIGIAHRDDLRSALFATLVSHPGQRPLFDQAFDAFWRGPACSKKPWRGCSANARPAQRSPAHSRRAPHRRSPARPG